MAVPHVAQFGFGRSVRRSSGSSQAVQVSPRVSFLAIAILGLGVPFALAFRRLCNKAAKVAVAALLLTFVRPEFTAAFYAVVAVAAVSSLCALWFWWRRGRDRVGVGFAEIAIPGFSLLVIATLTTLWPLPALSLQGRAFLAFGQHYSFRYVADHGLAESPWQDCAAVMANEFPRATTVESAFRLDPQKDIPFSTTRRRLEQSRRDRAPWLMESSHAARW
jgi:hypothetical protein